MTREEATQTLKELKRSGGPLYPCCEITYGSEGGWTKVNEFQGLTRKDWLTGLIIKGLVSNPNLLDNDRMNQIATGIIVGKSFVDCAKHLADATIVEGDE